MEPFEEMTVTVNLSIKAVPEIVAEPLTVRLLTTKGSANSESLLNSRHQFTPSLRQIEAAFDVTISRRGQHCLGTLA